MEASAGRIAPTDDATARLAVANKPAISVFD
jgi:hypothetical protein